MSKETTRVIDRYTRGDKYIFLDRPYYEYPMILGDSTGCKIQIMAKSFCIFPGKYAYPVKVFNSGHSNISNFSFSMGTELTEVKHFDLMHINPWDVSRTDILKESDCIKILIIYHQNETCGHYVKYYKDTLGENIKFDFINVIDDLQKRDGLYYDIVDKTKEADFDLWIKAVELFKKPKIKTKKTIIYSEKDLVPCQFFGYNDYKRHEKTNRKD